MANPIVLALAIVSLASAAIAQDTKPAAAAPAAAPSTGSPQRDTMIKLLRRTTIDFKDSRLEDVMNFLATVTGADLEVMWQDDRHTTGLDKDKTITLKIANLTALDAIEKVLERARDESSGTGGNTWQFSETGTLQVGPKARLNAYRRLEVYGVKDLLVELPVYDNAPEFDLQAALQERGRGGGGAQPPIRDRGRQNQQNQKTEQEKADELKKLITTLIEPEQWVDNGGEGATITYFQGSFLVNAPDYVHRAVDGYPWWPSEQTSIGTANGRRYVSFNASTGVSKVKEFVNHPITATTGGGGGGTGGGGAGGGGNSSAPGTANAPKNDPQPKKPN